MKIPGSVWNEYLASWPDGQWFDDHDVLVNGKEEGEDEVKGTDVVTFTGGTIYLNDRDLAGISLSKHFNKWKKSLTTQAFIVTVPNAMVDEFMKFAKDHGIKLDK